MEMSNYFVQADNAQQVMEQAADRLVGRQMAAQYQLGIQERGPAGQYMAGQALGRLIGIWLTRIFSR